MLYKLGLLLYHRLKNNKTFDLTTVYEKIKFYLIIYAVSTAILILMEETIYGYDFLGLIIAFIVYKSPEIVSLCILLRQLTLNGCGFDAHSGK